MDILSNLLKAQCDMAEWKFLPSLLHLHESHVKLSSWCHILPPAEVRPFCYDKLCIQCYFNQLLYVTRFVGDSGLEVSALDFPSEAQWFNPILCCGAVSLHKKLFSPLCLFTCVTIINTHLYGC